MRVLVPAVAALCLPAILFVSICLPLVEANVSEIRSLQKLYQWIVSGFIAVWLMSLPVMIAAARGWLEWAARSLIVLGLVLLVWDQFRWLWLGSWLWVGLAAVLEVALLIVAWRALRRIAILDLMGYVAVLALLQIAAFTALHVQGMGPKTVERAFRELVIAFETQPDRHPDPWTRLPNGAVERTGALALSQVAATTGASLERDGSGPVRIVAGSAGTLPLAHIPLGLAEPLADPAVAAIDLRVAEGSIRVGIRLPSTGLWFYRRDVAATGPEALTIYVPIFAGARDEALEFTGTAESAAPAVFEIDSLRLYRLPHRIGGEAAAASRHRGNVYQILLDKAQDDDYLALARDLPELRFDGFTLYSDFHSSSALTLWSLPTIVSSTLYDPARGDPATQWAREAFQRGMQASLREAGIPIYDYAFYRNWCYRESDFCYTTQDFRTRVLQQTADYFIVDLAFLRLLPNSLRAVLIKSPAREKPPSDSWDLAFSITDRFVDSAVDPRVDSMLKSVRFLIYVFTPAYFEEMLAEESMRPAAGQYIFFHAMLPHEPHLRDGECAIIPESERTPERKGELKRSQNVCTYRLLAKFFEHLKRLGRYEDATIIVHSDHGAPEPPPSADPEDKSWVAKPEWPLWAVESKAAGLLMVKWPRARGFEVRDDLPLHTLDLGPTVLRQFDLPIPRRFEGYAIQDMPPDFSRTKVFFTDDARGAGVTEFGKYTRGPGEGWIFRGTIPARP